MKSVYAVLALVLSVASARAEMMKQHDLLVINNAGRTIISIHAINNETGIAAGDLLESSLIEPGGSTLIVVNDGTRACSWSLKATLTGGYRTPWRSMNICDTATFTITIN